MNKIKKFVVSTTVSILVTFCGLSSANELLPEITPNPDYTPNEVVGIQMRALGTNDKLFDNAGIELTFRFASPGNREITGPLERFRVLFEDPAYVPMLNHAQLKIGSSTFSEGAALVPVLIQDNDGNQAGYMFFLSQQTEPPFENCWMTDSVIRIRIPNNQFSIL